MIKAKKANRVVTIKESEIVKYVGHGYTIIENGEDITPYAKGSAESIKREMEALQRKFDEATQEIISLKAEIARLKKLEAKKPVIGESDNIDKVVEESPKKAKKSTK